MEATTETSKTDKSMWSVIDLNATKGPRKHEIPIKVDASGEVLMTKTYILDAEVGMKMDPEHAMFFLKDPAFLVADAEGTQVKPVVQREGGIGGFRLGENEVIAQYDELSKEALFKRCKILVGADHIKETRTPKEEMIAFLVAKDKPPVGVSRGSEGIAENFELADKLLAA